MSQSPHVHERELLCAEGSEQPASESRPPVTRSAPSFSQSFLLGPMPKLNTILQHQASCDPEEDAEGAMELDDHTIGTAGCRTRLCSRHQRMTDSHAADQIQSSIENLSLPDKTAVNNIWSQFAAAHPSLRQLILKGLLSICCPSQLSFLNDELRTECRIDPLSLLPREISLRIMRFLDASSLCRAAQVSKHWRTLADDDMLWRKMCEQHIEKKCDKCGWGLPLMERTRRTRLRSRETSPTPSASPTRPGAPTSQLSSTPTSQSPFTPYQAVPASTADGMLPPLPPDAQAPGAPAPVRVRTDSAASQLASANAAFQSASGRPSQAIEFEPLRRTDTPPGESVTDPSLAIVTRPPKRDRRGRVLSPSGSPQQSPAELTPAEGEALCLPSLKKRPWKSVYSERLIIERNWRKGSCAVQVFSGHTDAVTCLQVEENLHHPSFPVLMTGSWDRTVRIWNLETGEEVGCLRGHERGIRALQFDSNKLITGSMDSTLKIWNWRTGEVLRTLTGHSDAVTCLVAEKNTIVSGSADSTIRVWDFDRGVVVCLRGHSEWINDVKLWSPPTAEDLSKPTKTLKPFLSKGFKKTLDPDIPPEQLPVRLLFSAGDDGHIRVWDLRTNNCVRVLESHVAQVQSLSIGTVFTAHHTDKDGNVSQDESNPMLADQPADGAPASPNGANVIGYFEDRAADCHSSNSQRFPCLRIDEPPQCQVGPAGQRPGMPPIPTSNTPALPPLELGDAKPIIFSGSLDNTLKEWDVEKATCKRTLFGHVQGVWDLDMDKLRIISASHDRTVKVWEREPTNGAPTSRCLHTLVGHRGAVITVRMTDDRIISGSDDGDVRVWSFNSTH